MDFRTFRRAQAVIGQGALTNSKHPDSFVKGVYPTHLRSCHGATVTSEGGQVYRDYICGLGTNLMGYSNPRINQAVMHAMASYGPSPSLPTLVEIEAAEGLKKIFTWAPVWKFVKTGTEACLAALRMARAHTGRDVVLSEGYHGWSDPFVSLTKPARGVPMQLSVHEGGLLAEARLSIDDLGSLKFITDKVAAVIVEPVIYDDGPERIAWLCELRERCSAVGAVLIFDEIITGCRYMDWSVSRAHGVTPDLVCVGKSIANGWPLAAVGGPMAIVSGDYFVSSTYAGEVYSLAACRAVVDSLTTSSSYNVNDLFARGNGFRARFNAISELIQIKGYGTRGAFFPRDDLVLGLFFQEACKAGILFGKSWFYNWDLMTYDDQTIEACRDILRRIERGEVEIQGQLPKSPFAAKVRG